MGKQILVVPADKVQISFKDGWYSGKNHSAQLLPLLEQSLFMDRDLAETDPSFKQFIPYCVLKCKDKFFIYERGKKGGEKRLHNLYSCGLGGHVDANPLAMDAPSTYWASLVREMKEEVGLESKDYTQKQLGFIYDPTTKVGEVHLGVCHLLTMLNSDKELVIENTMPSWSFEKLDMLERTVNSFEVWSQILIRNGILK